MADLRSNSIFNGLTCASLWCSCLLSSWCGSSSQQGSSISVFCFYYVECKLATHVECRDKLSSLCIPSDSTPTKGSQGNRIVDFCPSDRPYVPSIILQCVNEVCTAISRLYLRVSSMLLGIRSSVYVLFTLQISWFLPLVSVKEQAWYLWSSISLPKAYLCHTMLLYISVV